MYVVIEQVQYDLVVATAPAHARANYQLALDWHERELPCVVFVPTINGLSLVQRVAVVHTPRKLMQTMPPRRKR